jgi:hypothetical protein
MDKTLERVAHKLDVARGILYQAALEAETLKDQGLAEDLHMLHADIVSRLIPAVRKAQRL